jgi:DNA (cytosine-5)-methyltransferase 1
MAFEGGGCLNGLALCSGYGGLELGLERFFPGFKTVCHVESEAFAVSHLIKKMEEGWLHQAPVWDDLRTFEGDRWRGKVDIITGGFPCQPFSVAGNQLGDKDERHLWPFIVEIIRSVRPRFLFFENVPGVVKWILHDILLDLASLGYNASWCIVRAADVGAPHSRARWFLWAESCDSYCDGFENDSTTERSHRVDNKRGKNLEGFGRELEINGGNSSEKSTEYLSNTDSQGIQRQRSEYEKYNREGESERFFNSGDKWDGGFGSWWEVEPELGRLVDGASDWVDKLRILGNGVVPQQAHYALSILTSTMDKWRDEE